LPNVCYVIGEAGKYDTEYERQMQHMRTALHSQAVSSIILIMFSAFSQWRLARWWCFSCKLMSVIWWLM